jgi:hypothetical protein
LDENLVPGKFAIKNPLRLCMRKLGLCSVFQLSHFNGVDVSVNAACEADGCGAESDFKSALRNAPVGGGVWDQGS